MVEEWRAVPGQAGYEISNHGQVRSYRNERGHPKPNPRILKASRVRGGYRRVKFGRGPMISIHALVLEIFVGPRPPGLMVRHLDGDTSNNKIDNLRWGTAEENYADRHDHGTANDGSRNGRARLTEAQVLEIHRSTDRGVDLARRYGVTPVIISHIRTGRTWRKLLEAAR